MCSVFLLNYRPSRLLTSFNFNKKPSVHNFPHLIQSEDINYELATFIMLGLGNTR